MMNKTSQLIGSFATAILLSACQSKEEKQLNAEFNNCLLDVSRHFYSIRKRQVATYSESKWQFGQENNSKTREVYDWVVLTHDQYKDEYKILLLKSQKTFSAKTVPVVSPGGSGLAKIIVDQEIPVTQYDLTNIQEFKNCIKNYETKKSQLGPN